MACHNAVHFLQNGGKYYKDIIGAYPGFFGATAFKAMVNNQVKSAKVKGLDRLSKAEVTRRGLDDLRAVSRDFLACCIDISLICDQLEIAHNSHSCTWGHAPTRR